MNFNQRGRFVHLMIFKSKEDNSQKYIAEKNYFSKCFWFTKNHQGWLQPLFRNRFNFLILILTLVAHYGMLKEEIIGRPIFSQPSVKAHEILRKVDENFASGTKIIKARMIIHGRRGSRSLEFKTYLQGMDKGFTEFLAPPRERGTKMLKLGDQLWTYTPSSDRIILISGHMLRQSIMGSDLSYEDMLEDRRLLEIYEPEIVAEERILDNDCWVLRLKAKKAEVAYPSRKIWVDKGKFLILKEERYARSGALLKTAEVRKVGQFQKRWVPVEAVYKDVLKEGQGTEFIIEDIQFDVSIPDYIFTKANLK